MISRAAQRPLAERPSRRRMASHLRWLGVCLAVVAGPTTATAQTIIVRNVAAGVPVELALTDRVVVSATANANGDATLVVPASAGMREAMDALVFVDTCQSTRRVTLTGRADRPAPPEAGCLRQEISGVFFVQPISTLVVTFGESGPTLLLRQGAFDPDRPPRTWLGPPTGLIVFGGTGLTAIGEARIAACGNVAECDGDGSGLGFTAGVQYWFRPFLGAEVTYLQPSDTTAEGGGQGYRFSSTFKPRVLTVGGLAGVPAGPLRVYGSVAATYYQASFITDQTVDPLTLTIDGTPVQVPGGTQVLGSRTGGWRWGAGLGVDVWFTRYFAVYGDLRWIKLKGEDLDAGEAFFEDTMSSLMVGARFRLGF